MKEISSPDRPAVYDIRKRHIFPFEFKVRIREKSCYTNRFPARTSWPLINDETEVATKRQPRFFFRTLKIYQGPLVNKHYFRDKITRNFRNYGKTNI